MNPVSAPPTDSVPQTSRIPRPLNKSVIVAAVVAACATIAAALIAKEDRRQQPTVQQQMAGIQVCVHENGVIIADPLKVVGPDGYKASFENGDLNLPACQGRFAIYRGNGPRKLVGTFIWTGYTPRGAFMIHIEQKTECWEPAVFPSKID